MTCGGGSRLDERGAKNETRLASVAAPAGLSPGLVRANANEISGVAASVETAGGRETDRVEGE
jgi:hypothetical protein